MCKYTTGDKRDKSQEKRQKLELSGNNMPKVLAQGKAIECKSGANLRKVLLANDVDLYNGGSNVINCRGIGSCGTYAARNLRLACQTKVLGDVTVTKYDGFWGHGSQIVWTSLS